MAPILTNLTPPTRRIRTRAARIAVAALTAFWTSGAASLGFAQEVIELPDENRWLEADFQEVYRVGADVRVALREFSTIRQVAIRRGWANRVRSERSQGIEGPAFTEQCPPTGAAVPRSHLLGRERSGIRATRIDTWSGAPTSTIAPSPRAEARRS